MEDVNQSKEEKLVATAPINESSGGDVLHCSSHRSAAQVCRGHHLTTADVDVLCKKLLETENHILPPCERHC